MMEAGHIEFNMGSYIGISAIPKGQDFESEAYSNGKDHKDFLITWADAKEFSKSLRKAADFLDKHRKNYHFEIDID